MAVCGDRLKKSTCLLHEPPRSEKICNTMGILDLKLITENNILLENIFPCSLSSTTLCLALCPPATWMTNGPTGPLSPPIPNCDLMSRSLSAPLYVTTASYASSHNPYLSCNHTTTWRYAPHRVRSISYSVGSVFSPVLDHSGHSIDIHKEKIWIL